MKGNSLCRLPAHQLRFLLLNGQVSCEEILLEYLAQIEKVEYDVHAYLTIFSEASLAEARRQDALLSRQRSLKDTSALLLPPLLGIPVAIKDNICLKGAPTTCASGILEGYSSPYEATVVQKLRDAGAIVVGKTNMDEFAMGSSTENSAYVLTRNPWDHSRVPGGSSGGSAAAVAAGEACLALGSDTGGSIRQPASFCGVVGLKPTYGRVSRYGLVAFASSLDQIGPLTRDVKDSALLLGVLAGHDPLDSTSARLPVPKYSRLLEGEIKGIKVGLPTEFLSSGNGAGVDPQTTEAVNKAALLIEEMGGEIEEVSLPSLSYALPAYYLIASAEASSNLARYDGARYGYRDREATNTRAMFAKSRGKGFGKEVKRRIMLGTYALSAGYYEAFYLKAQKIRTLIKRDFDAAFKSCSVLLTPTSPTPAFKIGEKIEDPLTMYLSDIFTIPVNLAGLPGLSLPFGFSREGLPIGVQLLADSFKEEILFQVAYALEQHAGTGINFPPGL